MPGYLFILLIFPIISSFAQESYPRPNFPDVFQTEIEGTFRGEDEIVEMDATMFYDREKNRAALFILRNNELRKGIYNFDSDELITIDGNDCSVEKIPDQQGFIPFTIVKGKKVLSSAEKAFFFTEAKFERQKLSDDGIPMFIYSSNIDIPQYEKTNCALTHSFSKPEFELATCKEGYYCNSTLISVLVECKNEEGETDVYNVYRFFRFKYNIEDESVFLPPPGIHCPMKNTKTMPPFPSYFSFAFGIVEITTDIGQESPLFNMHKEIWYDADYKILRLDEFEYDSLRFSSRIFDMNSAISFTMIGSQPTCGVGPVTEDFKIDVTTRLPKIFFPQNDSSAVVFVGQRKVHGMNYQVWSHMWSDTDTTARVVEEVYYLKIDSTKDLSFGDDRNESFQVSHIDMYTYNMDEDTEQYKLVLLKHISINNFRTNPKEFSAYDVSSCFEKKQKKEFSIKIEKFPIVKGSQAYKEVLELFYNKIITATGVSVIRINDLRGIFDGVQLLEIRGSILDNSNPSNWPTTKKEPGMEQTFKVIKKAATEGKLTVEFVGENKQRKKIKVISVETLDESPPPRPKQSCFSGASIAISSIVLFAIGLSFGIIGYYVFLKKRRLANDAVRMQDIKS